MARISKEERLRLEGMAQAYRIAQTKGMEGLKQDIEMRKATGIPVGVSPSAIDESIRRIKENTVDTVRILAAMTLRDEFGFGKTRLDRFVQRFNLKTECLQEEYVTWEDMTKALKEELGITFEIRKNEDNVTDTQAYRQKRHYNRSEKRAARKFQKQREKKRA
jgi:hypothetical protein